MAVDETRLQLYTKYKEHKNYQKPELPENATFAVLKYYLGKYGYDGDIDDIFDTSTLTEEEHEILSMQLMMANAGDRIIRLVATLSGVNITQIQVYYGNHGLRDNQVILDEMPTWYPNLTEFKSYIGGHTDYDPAKWFGDDIQNNRFELTSLYKYIEGEVYKRTEEDIQTDWIVTKIAQASFRDESESAELVEKYSIQLAERDSWREKINTLEAEIAELPESF